MPSEGLGVIMGHCTYKTRQFWFFQWQAQASVREREGVKQQAYQKAKKKKNTNIV